MNNNAKNIVLKILKKKNKKNEYYQIKDGNKRVLYKELCKIDRIKYPR